MTESLYKGYPALFANKPVGGAVELMSRPDEITLATFEGLGTAISVDGIPDGRNPQVIGAFHDPRGVVDMYFLVKINDGRLEIILVPPSNIKIG